MSPRGHRIPLQDEDYLSVLLPRFGRIRYSAQVLGGVTVACFTGAAAIFRKVVLMTLIGFGVVVLSGPAIAIIGTLLPFALVGGLVWLLVQPILLGPRVVWGTIRGGVRLVLALPL